MEWQWHQLDHMQIICTSLQTDNHDSTSSLSFYLTGRMPFLLPNQQCLSTEVDALKNKLNARWKLLCPKELAVVMQPLNVNGYSRWQVQ